MSMILHSNPRLPHFEGERLPWIGGDLQTLRHFIRRDIKPLEDGEALTVTLDDGDRLLAAFHAPADHDAEGKMRGGIIAVHGLTGSMDSDHINVLTRDALCQGYAVLRVNMRGAGPARKLAKKSYSAKAGADLLPFIKMMRGKIGDDLPVVMVAHSIGGAAALNMMLDFPDQLNGLNGLVSVAAPIDMMASNARFNALRNRVYMKYLLNGLKALADEVPEIAPDVLAKIKTVQSIKEFDDVYTGPNMGYADAYEYYAAATVAHRLEDVPIRTLLIHGGNDPWIPKEAYLSLTPSAMLDVLVSDGGGHVGFHDAKGIWSNRAIFSWLGQYF